MKTQTVLAIGAHIGDAELTADDLQLLDGGGAVNIAGDEQRALALLFE